jgi:hypothetical protein
MKLRNILIVLASCALAAPCVAADRTLEESFAVDGIDSIRINNGVGDVRIAPADSELVSVAVTLIPRRGGVFSSMRKAEQEVEAARLTASEHRGVLRLEVESESDEPRFEARWQVTAPSRFGVEVEVGVGDLDIAGFTGGVEVEVGVGDASIEVGAGDVEASVGVGDVLVRAPSAAYGAVEATGGVGSASIDAGDESTSGKGFVGETSSWRGDGPHEIELEVGVGDARVVLE